MKSKNNRPNKSQINKAGKERGTSSIGTMITRPFNRLSPFHMSGQRNLIYRQPLFYLLCSTNVNDPAQQSRISNTARIRSSLDAGSSVVEATADMTFNSNWD